jgi:hypothetical protein
MTPGIQGGPVPLVLKQTTYESQNFVSGSR